MSNEKIRIFCVITQGETGGAQQFVAELAQHLNPDRFLLRLVWGADSGSALARHLPEHVSHALVSHLVRKVSPIDDLKAVRELRNMMLAFQPDVVFCVSSKAGFVGSLAANGLRNRLPGLKVIYRIGGWTFNDPWPSWKKRFYLSLERISARWKDTIVVNNTHDLEQTRTLRIKPKDRVVRIYNGIEPYLDFLPYDQARQELVQRIADRYRTLPHDWLVGTIANFYPAKDLATLVRAAAQVSENVRFIIIGDGPQRSELEQQIARHGLQNRVFLLGSIPDAYRLLTGLDVFILPSVKEGFPWAILEAMAARVPVIATRVGAVPEMIESGVSGIIIEPSRPDQLAQAIVHLLENDRLRRELAIQAHQRVLTHFSLRSMIDQYERLFQQE